MAPNVSVTTTRLDALFATYQRADSPGVVAGIVHRGRVLYRRGFGMASLEHGIANTPATRMRIGSVSKQFACLAVLLLGENGALDADAPIGTYLPDLSPAAGAPTLRQLMSHRGGQRCALDLALLTQGLAISPRGALLASQQRQREENFPPGERMMYSNGGYHLLSLAIERASGMPFDAFLATHIFKPMHMRDTACAPNDMTIGRGIATMHVPDGRRGFRRGIFPSWDLLGEGSIVSTIDDMLRWTAHLHSPVKVVGSADTWAQMLALPLFSSGQRSQYSLGLKQSVYRGVALIHHSGGVVGGTCQMLLSAEHGLEVVLLSNGAVDAPFELAKRVVDVVLACELSGDGPPAAARAADHAARLGSYRSSTGGAVYALEDRDGALVLTGLLCPKPSMTLHDSADDLNDVEIEASADGPLALRWGSPVAPHDLSCMRIVHCGHAEMFTRLGEAPAMTPCLIEGMCGTFESHDANARATIGLDGEALVLRMHGAVGSCDYHLTPLASDVFGLTPVDPMDIMTGIVTLTRDAAGAHVTSFRVDTARTRHLAFTPVRIDA
ncbi:serine hydrolase domain-containing protein [Paraburkholderia bryophila]|uniref:CubicO group peptidase (Beta-lactamase class C family) n=1 Tax=Paraburkholderia bryophila TaxID=420952 RepID=A0A7Y9WCR3_9BURK|nr:serine hydrolase domain-containing protein [Paraburkholderia bryophila]NYH18429.1 CubicO group peptidase (beta-lactamase class C family) [Paraburkholderia bryophila]